MIDPVDFDQAGRGAPVAPGHWVEIQCIALKAGERAPQVPVDTREVPLEMRVRGFLDEAACIGAKEQITTVTGRRVRGVLLEVNPAYQHSFGPPLDELLAIRTELRELLSGQGDPS